jgi:hypothetical protein
VKLDQGTGNAAQVSYLHTTFPIWTPPTAAYRFLSKFDLQATTSTLNSREWHIGLLERARSTFGFLSQYNQANWQATTTSRRADTGVAVAVGATWVHFGI